MAQTRWLLVAVLLVMVFVTSQGGSDPGKKRVRRVIGGVAAAKGEYPYLASILIYRNSGVAEFNNGGVLVRTDWVVSTAHHFWKGYEEHMLVKLGVYNRSDTGNAQVCNVSKLIQHPQYNKINDHYDIMLLKLNCRGTRSANVKPAAINTDPACPAVNQTVTVVGWGQTKRRYRDSSSQIPRKADLKVFGTGWSMERFKKLEKGLRESEKGAHDIKTMIFAGVKLGGRDACGTDSGGPLVAKCGNTEVPVGLVSYGYGCAYAYSPGVYTRLSAFKDWIDKTIKEEDEKDGKKSG